MIGVRVVALAICLTVFGASEAWAQGARRGTLQQRGTFPQRGSTEVGGGGAWAQAFDIGSQRADLSRSTPGDRFDLFSTETRLNRAAGGYARVGVYLTRAVSVEAGVRYATPMLAIRVSGDAESAADEDATGRVSQYIIEGALLWHVTGASFAGGQGVPFVSAGGGHIRELHEGNELVETGRQFHMSAGLKYWSGGGRRRAGLRGEIGFLSREEGISPGEERRTVPFAMAGVTFLF